MTPSDLKLWQRVQRRAAEQSPEMTRAILKAYRWLREHFTDSELLDIIAAGAAEQVIRQALSDALLEEATLPVREQIRQATFENARYFVRDVPVPASQTITFGFDSLSPNVIAAIRQLETRVITTMSTDIRETVRLAVENGLRSQMTPKAIARDLREVIGLAPNQLEAVNNFRASLENAHNSAKPLDYALRDKRFDSVLRKARASGDPIAPEKIAAMEAAYRRRMQAFAADNVSRTATLDTLKLGQHLAIQDAIDRGILDGERVQKTWSGVMDSRERPEHVAMQNETVPWGEPYSNGQMIPGDTDYNCRCLSRITQARAAQRMVA